MRRWKRWCAALGVATAMGGVGCKRSGEQAGGPTQTGPGGTGATTQAPAAEALRPVGMDNPFQRLTGDAAKQLNAGFAALKGKRWDDARAAFQKVRELVPDHTQARWYEVRATALGGHFADVVPLWGELLSRDYVAYAGRLDKAKELAPLRAAPEWAKLQDLEKKYAAAYAAGLSDGAKGFFFVARSRDFQRPEKEGAKLALNQELYHFTTATGRYRRLTATDGHTYAYAVSPDRRTIAFLTVIETCMVGKKGPGICLSGAGTIDLPTLATVGPFRIDVDVSSVSIGFDKTGQPFWQADEGQYQLDAAHTALVSVESTNTQGTEAPGNVTTADVDSVDHKGAPAADVTVEEKAITLKGAAAPLRVSRPIAPASVEWSPGHKKLVYAGTADPCSALSAGKTAEKNELFVWDADKKVASRVAHEVATFETLWLDDDHLVYEGGIGRDGRIHLYDFATRADTVLKPTAGAGIWGYPVLLCESPPDNGIDESKNIPDDTDGGAE